MIDEQKNCTGALSGKYWFPFSTHSTICNQFNTSHFSILHNVWWVSRFWDSADRDVSLSEIRSCKAVCLAIWIKLLLCFGGDCLEIWIQTDVSLLKPSWKNTIFNHGGGRLLLKLIRFLFSYSWASMSVISSLPVCFLKKQRTVAWLKICMCFVCTEWK